MIQGGDPLGRGTGGPGYQFEDEFQSRRRVRQARPAGDGERRPQHQRQPVLHHRGAHPWLDNKHTIFGEVVTGMDVVEASRQRDPQGHRRPSAD